MASEIYDDEQSMMQYLTALVDAGCKIDFRTELFGKPYVWMRDPMGNTFLERLPDAA